MGFQNLPVCFAEKIEESDGCWLWRAAINRGGYGVFWEREYKRTVIAHRFAFQYLIGPVPPGLDLDHLCRVRNCVNPAHLEPVTRRVNLSRGIGDRLRSERAKAQTHCLRGHLFDEENTAYKSDGARRCRTCHRQSETARRQKARAA